MRPVTRRTPTAAPLRVELADGSLYEHCALQATLAADIALVPFLQHGERLPYRAALTGWSWSVGVRYTIPFWYHGRVRRARTLEQASH